MASTGLSRRGFLNLVGRAGGSSALYQTMAAMGLLRVPEAYAGPPSLPPVRSARIVPALGRLLRSTWRNFFTPDRRDIWAGFRTCATG